MLRALAGGHDRKESGFFTGIGRRSRRTHPGPGGYCKHRFDLLPYTATVPQREDDDGVEDDNHEYRTIVYCSISWLPDLPGGWEIVRSFASSGETNCGWCGDGTGNEDTRKGCKLCGGDGLIYLGGGWHEIVASRAERCDKEDCEEEGHEWELIEGWLCHGHAQCAIVLKDVPQEWRIDRE